LLPYKLKHKLHTLKTFELPKDGRQLRPEHVEALINKRKSCSTSWCQPSICPLPCSQQLATSPYPQPHQCSKNPPTIFFMSHLNTTLQCRTTRFCINDTKEAMLFHPWQYSACYIQLSIRYWIYNKNKQSFIKTFIEMVTNNRLLISIDIVILQSGWGKGFIS
jgi:hypothetical protein